MNLCNECFVGKFFITETEGLNIPLYTIDFIDDEASKYKLNPSNYFMELVSEKQWIRIGCIFLNLPSVDEVMDEIEADLAAFM